VIPIVYGGADYEKLAPKNSFINALNFSSPKKLVKKLQEINEDDTTFASYFWWKDFYEVSLII